MNQAPSDSAIEALDLRVIAVEPAGKDTKLFRLVRADHSPLPAVAAGAHIALRLPNGLERQYSLLSPGPAPAQYEIAVKKEADGRGGSASLHDHLAAGDSLAATPPRNDFPLREDAALSILIGGGIGITPLIAMAERLTELGRPFRFHAAFRSAADILLPDRIGRYAQLALHLDDEAGGLFPMVETVSAAPPGAHLYCCGPAPMIESFLASAKAAGRDEATLHFEYFTPPAAAPQADSFIVELARSGLELTVPPRKSILAVVREAGIDAPSSCEQGTCGACETKVLAGIPDHFDAVLTPQDRKAGKSMMICCSGSLTDRLVLDL